jgi:hypothetical protein
VWETNARVAALSSSCIEEDWNMNEHTAPTRTHHASQEVDRAAGKEHQSPCGETPKGPNAPDIVEGDAYLRHLANALERNMREGDWISRRGGDEFVVAFWDAEGCPLASQKAIVKRVGEYLQRNPVRLTRGDGVGPMSFSAGVCRHRGYGEGARELFSRADAALLEAKKEGRDTIVEAS